MTKLVLGETVHLAPGSTAEEPQLVLQAGSIELPYTLGGRFWTPSNGHRDKWIVCPECAGKKVVALILGNGEEYQIECRCCQSGFDPPRGQILYRYFQSVPQVFVPRSVTVEANKFRYSSTEPQFNPYCNVDCDNIFVREEDCRIKCDALNAEHQANADKMALAHLESKRRDCAWSVHYWRGQKRKLLADLARLDQKLIECVERGKKVKCRQCGVAGHVVADCPGA